MTQYETRELTEKLGIPRLRLQDWENNGFVKATYPAGGKGSRRYYSKWDIIGIVLFKKLLDRGISREEAGEYYESWHDSTLEVPIKTRLDIAHAVFINTARGEKAKKSKHVNFAYFARSVLLFDKEFHILEGIARPHLEDYYGMDYEDAITLNMAKIIAYVDALFK